MKKRSLWSKVGGFLLGKGFYMVLLLCVMAIGGSGYYLYNLAHTALVPSQQPVSAPAQVEVQTVKPEQTQQEPAVQSASEVKPSQTEKAAEQTSILPKESDPAVEGEQAAQAEKTQQEPAAETAAEAAAETAAEAAAETKAEQPAQEPAKSVFFAPVEGEAVAAFSASELSYNAALDDWRTHNGVDLSAHLGDGVYAAKDGEVLSVSNDLLLGTTVTLNHGDGMMTVYANLSPDLEVEQGQRVNAGQMIGTVGETALGERNEGAWLHFAVLKNGESVDPMPYLEEG